MKDVFNALILCCIQEINLEEEMKDPRLKAILGFIEEDNMPNSLLNALSTNAQKFADENEEIIKSIPKSERELVTKGHHLLSVEEVLMHLPKDNKIKDIDALDPYTKFLIDKLKIDKNLTVKEVIDYCKNSFDSIGDNLGEQERDLLMKVIKQAHDNYSAKDKFELLHSMTFELDSLSRLLKEMGEGTLHRDKLKDIVKHLEKFLSSYSTLYKYNEDTMNLLYPTILGVLPSLTNEPLCSLLVHAIFRGEMNQDNESILVEYFLKQSSLRGLFEDKLAEYILRHDIHDLDSLNISDTTRATLEIMVTDKLQHERIKAASHRLGTSRSSSIFQQISEEVGLRKSPSYTYVSLISGTHLSSEEEGAYDRQSARWLKADISAVIKRHGDILTPTKREIFEHSQAMLDKIYKFDSTRSLETEKFADELYNDYEKGKPIMIPAGSKGHSVTVVAWGNYLSVTNRGLGKSPNGGTIIIKLDEPLAKKDIKEILDTKDADLISNLNLKIGTLGGGHKSKWYRLKNAIYRFLARRKLTDAVLSLTGLNPTSNMPNMIGSIPQKGQKYGTCSFVNKKGALEPLMALGDIMQARHPDKDLFGQHVFKSTGKSKSEEQADFTTSLADARRSYKETTADIRDIEIERLISTIKANRVTDLTEEQKSNTQALVDKVISYIEYHHHIKNNPIIQNRELERSQSAYKDLLRLGIDPKPRLSKDTLKTINATELDKQIFQETTDQPIEQQPEYTVDSDRAHVLIHHLNQLSDLGYSKTPPAISNSSHSLRHNYKKDIHHQSATAPPARVKISSAPSTTQRQDRPHHPPSHH